MTKTKVFIYCVCAILHYCIGDAPEVKTSQGALKGAYFNAIHGKKYAAFMSLPYAQPPIGPLRFKAPFEAGSWEGVRDASQDAPTCVHNHPYFRSSVIIGVEDCLYLNVYTPSVSIQSSLLPVMVFFHGGGWMMGTGNKNLYGPDNLMERDIVLVGVNFRLAALGFLSTMDEAAPGNWLFKDQNMALRWIKKHIIHFGGDPNLVTIFGESAHHHTLSPMSQGLFHRAILQSGNALSFWGVSEPGRAQRQAKKLGKIMDCPTDDNMQMIECLRTKDAKDIIATDKLFYDWDYDPMIPFRPVIEPPNENSFLSEDPRVLFKEGRFAQVPTMHGISEGDGCIRSAAIFGVPGLMEEFGEKFDLLAPASFGYELANDPAVITAAIREFYLNGNTINIDTIMNTTNIYTDSYFTAGLDETLILSLPKASNPVYLFFFSFIGRVSLTVPFGDSVRNYGTCHGDEILYLFNMGGFPGLEGREKDVSDAFVTIWTNFAKTGDPSSPIRETKLGNIPSWPQLDASGLWKHVEIGDKLEQHDDLFNNRRNFWRSLPLWQKQHSAIYA
ncbi:carboxylic ester hydrolase-like [Arctopsyche grandis]|uniref:carboxylic ester hydrolase-like n=1 Tax=Arctopsyche grandis TaxID=121162 RepID=UPI00406D6EBA